MVIIHPLYISGSSHRGFSPHTPSHTLTGVWGVCKVRKVVSQVVSPTCLLLTGVGLSWEGMLSGKSVSDKERVKRELTG